MVMRVLSIWVESTRQIQDQTHYIYRAVLFAEGAKVAVQWVSPRKELAIEGGCLVTIHYQDTGINFVDGHMDIGKLVRLDRPDSSYNLFDTAPFEWFMKTNLIKDAQSLWELLAEHNRLLLNAVLFDGGIFRRFCEGPSSSNNHHSYFHGHKMNGLHLIVKAQAKYAPSYPQHSFDNLRHLLEVSEGNLSGGFRKPQMQEYMIVHNADRASVVNNLYSQAYVGKSYGMAPQGKDGLKLNYRYER